MSSASRDVRSPEIEAGLSIGEVAKRTGLSVHALRFYEREGIFADPVGRSSKGHRVYSEDHLEWLDTCSNLRASGMPLAAIRRYAELVRQGTGNEAERLTILRQHRERVIAQMSELNTCLDLISWKVGVYEDRLARNADP